MLSTVDFEVGGCSVTLGTDTFGGRKFREEKKSRN